MQLNYHHLRIFWSVARSGSLRAAGQELNLSQPTLSTQLRELEESLGRPLFIRAGRRLQLTAEGRIALGYAEDIFSLGGELQHALSRRDTTRARRLNVGITESLPKPVARELLRPAFSMQPALRVICQEGTLEELVARLADFRLDVVLSDEALSGLRNRGMFNHRLGSTGVIIAGVPELTRKFRRGFPERLEDSPMVLPTEAAPLRRAMEHWFQQRGLRPQCVAEFDDPAFMMDIASEGLGLAPVYEATQGQILKAYGLERVGLVDGVRTEFFAISAERRLRDSAVLAITQQAQKKVFG